VFPAEDKIRIVLSVLAGEMSALMKFPRSEGFSLT
jgi:hypothetical protein